MTIRRQQLRWLEPQIRLLDSLGGSRAIPGEVETVLRPELRKNKGLEPFSETLNHLSAAAGLAQAGSLRYGGYPCPAALPEAGRRRMDSRGHDFAENQACIGSGHLPCCRGNLNRRLTTQKPSFGFGRNGRRPRSQPM